MKVEHRSHGREPVRQLHLRDALRDGLKRSLDKIDSHAHKGILVHDAPTPPTSSVDPGLSGGRWAAT